MNHLGKCESMGERKWLRVWGLGGGLGGRSVTFRTSVLKRQTWRRGKIHSSLLNVFTCISRVILWRAISFSIFRPENYFWQPPEAAVNLYSAVVYSCASQPLFKCGFSCSLFWFIVSTLVEKLVSLSHLRCMLTFWSICTMEKCRHNII